MTADEFLVWASERPDGDVVEVLSPSTRARDAGAKLQDYFRLELDPPGVSIRLADVFAG